MKKFVTKTITELTYDSEGRVVKETVTKEEYEVETTTNIDLSKITSGTITTDKINVAKGVLPNEPKKDIPYRSVKPYTASWKVPDTNEVAKADTSGITGTFGEGSIKVNNDGTTHIMSSNVNGIADIKIGNKTLAEEVSKFISSEIRKSELIRGKAF